MTLVHLKEKRCPMNCISAETRFNHSSQRKDDRKHLLIRALPRAEIIAAYKQADVFFFPSNVECSPIVLFESAAAKLPFLTSDAGNAKEIIEWTNGGMLLPTEKDSHKRSTVKIMESVEILKEIYDDPGKRHAMGEAGFAAWQERFTWEKIAKDYEDLYDRLNKGY
jgi:glycosyltransferase involved in cell wall biosynthesis